jgi:ribosome biogenesis GTPase A
MIENINWYPGHMKKTRELIAANLRLVGAVVEVCDARIPVSSRNPVLDELIEGKPRILVFNKADLADESATKAWLARCGRGDDGRPRADERKGDSPRPPGADESKNKKVGAGEYDQGGTVTAVAMNSVAGDGIKKLLAALARIAAARVSAATPGAAMQSGAAAADAGEDASTRRGATAIAPPLRVMIVGVPNSGKSSLINRLAGRRAARTGDRPGVTRGKQWLTLAGGMQLLDTPGILWPKFDDPKVGLNLAFCGSIRDEIMDVPDLALELIRTLESLYPGALALRYNDAKETVLLAPGGADGEPDVSSGEDDGALAVMELIAERRGCILPGKRIDYERAGRMILDEFRAGKLGRITLEKAR